MNEQKDAHRLERGQALILIVFSIIALFGFAALAIDVGQLVVARRSAQNAADAAAFAAAYDAVAGSKNAVLAKSKAISKATTNGYTAGPNTWVVVNNPPVSDTYCGVCSGPAATEYYQVKITVQTKPIFSQLFYAGAGQTTVEAIAHAKAGGPFTSGDTILALSTDSDAIIFDGNNSVKVTNGNIRSNGGMTKNGGSGNIAVTSGKVYYNTTFSGKTGPFTGAQPQQSEKVTLNTVPEPYCPTAAEAASWTAGSGYKTKKIDGVNYYYYPSGVSGDKNFAAGIHCIKGDIDKGTYTGTNVLLVLLDGGIKQTGGDSFHIAADPNLIDKNGNQFGGMLIYAPASNTSELKFGGNSGESLFTGTIFTPGAFCNIGGTPDSKMSNTAFVCDKFKFHGNPDLVISYSGAALYQTYPSVELIQ